MRLRIFIKKYAKSIKKLNFLEINTLNHMQIYRKFSYMKVDNLLTSHRQGIIDFFSDKNRIWMQLSITYNLSKSLMINKGKNIHITDHFIQYNNYILYFSIY